MSERGSIGSTYTVVILILIVAATAVGTLIMNANKVDSVSEDSVQSATTNFVNGEVGKGRLSNDDLNKFTESITGSNNYIVEIEVGVVGENQGKKTSMTVANKNGENSTYVYFDSQVREQLDTIGYMEIPNGGHLTTRVYQTNITTAQELTGTNKYGTLVAEATATCTTD